ncbi:hypothetical protein O6H91_13G069600 [Diphasiastrum complanatum]|uniref:Uncharacterized protein n=4 Tax=Diphasiastrum complanatum TaxID=34168 RepID=A0ACC2BWX9_DIPCM|nr:hypothetical protein O6H91_Y136000 [Diphasiastrum complanatum]KAJ7296234.1 hypothetical protein O6H91_Y136000 [Diphasiastrum complanatum]KAJ7296235.1 hypothetical protein O6H91_Y136000 [Diphasiastrum complanatum]KAJ7296236.1 hypothetical protein O6H91_Y136000 [Diphasiastrum complanatum]KAJ7533896.1 hypothetical protein O6H91_13G069600 [Diphasiastrum complanatum]
MASIAVVLVLQALLLFVTAVSAQPQYACNSNSGSIQSYAFCNTSFDLSNRVRDLISRLTVQEKISQLVNKASAVPRLGISSYEWWQEALHGIAYSPGVQFGGNVPSATSFPQTILTAASFNTTLFYKIGQAISTEGRAMYNVGNSGATFWSPNINIYRDPRWGRGQETPGEDPVLSSQYGTYFVRGLQDVNEGEPYSDASAGLSRLKVSACCKHFTAYDLESWNGVERYNFNALVTQQDLTDTYNPPFQSCVQEGHVSGIMCSYNRVNGVPTCADRNLLTNTLRNNWGFIGYIVSDCDAVSLIYDATKYASSPEDAVADVLKAGLDLNCGSYMTQHAQTAYQAGKINDFDLDRALTNLFIVRMRLGLFDGDPKTQPYGTLGKSDICSDEHQQLALEAACQGIVLLKNEGRSLPLSQGSVKTLAVIGPNANAANIMLGNYHGNPCKYVTPLQGLQSYVSTVSAPGCASVACTGDDLISAAVDTATKADAVVLVVGLDITQETETHDRTSLLLPGQQQQLITQVASAAKVPVILVIMCGGPVDISFAKYDNRISSILWVGYPGEAGGVAIAQVIFGEYNPGGRLPVTWYPENYTQMSMLDMNMRPNPSTGYLGRTYRFYSGPTLFQFGEGLSFSSFQYQFTSARRRLSVFMSSNQSSSSELHKPSNRRKPYSFFLQAEDSRCETLQFPVKITVSNQGSHAGSHSVLLYHTPPKSSPTGSPKQQLIEFTRLHLEAGSESSVTFMIRPCNHLSTVKKDGSRIFHGGMHTLSVGDVHHRLSVMQVH